MKQIKNIYFIIALFTLAIFTGMNRVNATTYTLENGTAFNEHLSDKVSQYYDVVFGLYSTYKWDVYNISSDDNILTVDEDGAGTIKLYKSTKNSTIYILSEGTIAFNENSSGMFKEIAVKSSISFSNIDTSNVTDMSEMFSKLGFKEDDASLDLSAFKTSKVKNMSKMFYANGAQSITFGSNFKTDSVIDFSHMFHLAEAGNIDISSWNNKVATDTSYMFYCSNVASLSFSSGFTMENVTNTEYMFGKCTNLLSVNLSSAKFTNLQEAHHMFVDDSKLTTIVFGDNFTTNNLQNVYHMFDGCGLLSEINLSSFSTTSLAQTGYMFKNCTSLGKIYISRLWVNSNIRQSENMFYNCTSLKGYNEDDSYIFAFESNYTDKTYARINYDATKKGYFTYKSNTNEPAWDLNDYGTFYTITLNYNAEHLAITSGYESSYEPESEVNIGYSLRPGYIIYKVLINNVKTDFDSTSKTITIDSITKDTTIELKTIAENAVVDGDVNMDYEFNTLDISVMRNLLASSMDPEPEQMERMGLDAETDVYNASVFLKYMRLFATM